MAGIRDSYPAADRAETGSIDSDHELKLRRQVIDWLSKKSREEKRKHTEEQELRASLSEKLAAYERTQELNLVDTDDDHTEMMLNGKKVRVSKTQIDLAED